MATQYAFKAVTAGWADSNTADVQTPESFTVGSDVTAYATPRNDVFLDAVRFRAPGAASDARNAIVAFTQPVYPWGERGRPTSSMMPPKSGHLIRLTYDDVADLVANVGAQFFGDQTAQGLLLRACHVDAEMSYVDGAFVVI